MMAHGRSLGCERGSQKGIWDIDTQAAEEAPAWYKIAQIQMFCRRGGECGGRLL
jgi:hypothetical protein